MWDCIKLSDSFIMLTCYLTKAVNELKPVKVYNNFKEDRVQLIKDNNKKEAIYCLINLINGHSYIGSSNNLAGRMRNYLNDAFLNNKKNSNMPIIKALLKYGQNNFAVLIIEYVNFDKLAIRETHFISKLLPYYNVLKEGYSSVGYKHTEATKDMLSELAKNRVHSDQTKVLISAALIGKNNPFYNKTHSWESKLKIINAKSAYPVYIYDSYKKLLIVFPSVKTLANVINSNSATIVNYIKNEALFRGGWYFSSLPFNLSDVPLISDITLTEANNLILDIKNSSHIKKAIFVYNKNKELLWKFDGIMQAEKELKISHDTIKKYAPLNKPFGDYIFSYEILKD